jgi:hypothetical protein
VAGPCQRPSLFEGGQRFGVDEVDDGSDKELLDRTAHEFSHAPVGVAGTSVPGDPDALVGGLQDLGVEQRLALTIG